MKKSLKDGHAGEIFRIPAALEQPLSEAQVEVLKERGTASHLRCLGVFTKDRETQNDLDNFCNKIEGGEGATIEVRDLLGAFIMANIRPHGITRTLAWNVSFELAEKMGIAGQLQEALTAAGISPPDHQELSTQAASAKNSRRAELTPREIRDALQDWTPVLK